MTIPATYNSFHYLWVDYTNWHGKREWRRVIPINIECNGQPHHGDEPDWFMHVWMEDRKYARRTLRMRDIHTIKSGGPSPLSWGNTIEELQNAE